jgi:hypothetical protein
VTASGPLEVPPGGPPALLPLLAPPCRPERRHCRRRCPEGRRRRSVLLVCAWTHDTQLHRQVSAPNKSIDARLLANGLGVTSTVPCATERAILCLDDVDTGVNYCGHRAGMDLMWYRRRGHKHAQAEVKKYDAYVLKWALIAGSEG